MKQSVESVQHRKYIQQRHNQCDAIISKSTKLQQKKIIELLISGASYQDIMQQFFVTSALEEGVPLSFQHQKEAQIIAAKDYYVKTTAQSYLIYPKKVQKVLSSDFVPNHGNVLDYLKNNCGIRVIKNLPNDFPYSDCFVYDAINYQLLNAIYYRHTHTRLPAWNTVEHN